MPVEMNMNNFVSKYAAKVPISGDKNWKLRDVEFVLCNIEGWSFFNFDDKERVVKTAHEGLESFLPILSLHEYAQKLIGGAIWVDLVQFSAECTLTTRTLFMLVNGWSFSWDWHDENYVVANSPDSDVWVYTISSGKWEKSS